MTFAQLADMVDIILRKYPEPDSETLDLEEILRDVEDEFIERTFCTMDMDEYDAATDAEYDLPDGFVSEVRVEWGGNKLDPFNMSNPTTPIYRMSTGDEETGIPIKYLIDIDAGTIRVIPKPTSAKILRIWYSYKSETADRVNPIIPAEDQRKLVDGAKAQCLEIIGDDQRAEKFRQKFEINIRKARKKYHRRRFRSDRIHTTESTDFYRYSLQSRIGLVSESGGDLT